MRGQQQEARRHFKVVSTFQGNGNRDVRAKLVKLGAMWRVPAETAATPSNAELLESQQPSGERKSRQPRKKQNNHTPGRDR